MGFQFPSNLQFPTGSDWIEDTETVTVVRRVPTSTGGITQTTLYTGAADLQFQTGVATTDPLGTVGNIDAICIIDFEGIADFPAFLQGDVVQWTGAGGVVQELRVESVEPYSFAIPHVELMLKRGAARYDGPSPR